MNPVSEIYDKLFLFESSRKKKPYPVHKKLKPPSNDLLSLVSKEIVFDKNDKILDAGCGNGHTLFFLNEKFGCKGKGISISQLEVDFANKFARRIKKNDHLSFELKSYDDPLGLRYDKIFAIESLKHSKSISYSLENLFKGLERNGTIVIADDFKLKDSKNLENQTDLWEANSFMSRHLFDKILKASILDPLKIRKIDLTRYVSVRPKVLLQTMIFFVEFFLRFAAKRKRNLNTYLGGLKLELGYARKEVTYDLLFISIKERDSTAFCLTQNGSY